MKIKAFIGAALAALFLFALTASAESAENTPPTVPAGTGTVWEEHGLPIVTFIKHGQWRDDACIRWRCLSKASLSWD